MFQDHPFNSNDFTLMDPPKTKMCSLLVEKMNLRTFSLSPKTRRRREEL